MTFQSIKDIQAYISNMVSAKIDSGHVVNMHWAVTEILNDYSEISGEDLDFYLITAKHYVFEQVKKCVKKFEPGEDSASGQIVLDGFEHLQKAYPVKRGAVRELVPIQLLTDVELEERAQEYIAMAEGCTAHAEEIRDYITSRQQTA